MAEKENQGPAAGGPAQSAKVKSEKDVLLAVAQEMTNEQMIRFSGKEKKMRSEL